MSLVIFTKKPGACFSKESFKRLARKLWRRYRGPQGVMDSLYRGLLELGVSYQLNPRRIADGDTVYVNYSLDAWRWLLRQKKKKSFRLIAGPNIVALPHEADSIILNSETDLYLLPSTWVQSWWLSLKPELASRLRIWPAGTLDRGAASGGDLILVYRKNVPEDIYQMVLKVLREKKLPYKVIQYGKFKQPQYFKLLNKSRLMIYLQTSETQGLSLLEAWSLNVPTLVWRSEHCHYQGFSWSAPDIAAPYLTNEAGHFFTTADQLWAALSLPNNYSPRAYFLREFTDKKCAQEFLNLINEKSFTSSSYK